jgi:hypothetical protein
MLESQTTVSMQPDFRLNLFTISGVKHDYSPMCTFSQKSGP